MIVQPSSYFCFLWLHGLHAICKFLVYQFSVLRKLRRGFAQLCFISLWNFFSSHITFAEQIQVGNYMLACSKPALSLQLELHQVFHQW